MIRILGEQNTVLNQFVAELRDENIQKDAMRFRRNLERVGQLMAYEISRTLNYYPSEVATPLGQKPINLPTSRIVLATVLRAGLPFHSGFLSIFDKAENGFVSAYRHFSKDGTMHIKMEQVTTPQLEDKTLILIDPMLATGQSIEAAYNALIDKGGVPMQTHFAAIISSIEGLEYVKQHLPMDRITVWTVAVDEQMTVKNYIVPGIGDPGDLAYGKKI